MTSVLGGFVRCPPPRLLQFRPRPNGSSREGSLCPNAANWARKAESADRTHGPAIADVGRRAPADVGRICMSEVDRRPICGRRSFARLPSWGSSSRWIDCLSSTTGGHEASAVESVDHDRGKREITIRHTAADAPTKSDLPQACNKTSRNTAQKRLSIESDARETVLPAHLPVEPSTPAKTAVVATKIPTTTDTVDEVDISAGSGWHTISSADLSNCPSLRADKHDLIRPCPADSTTGERGEVLCCGRNGSPLLRPKASTRMKGDGRGPNHDVRCATKPEPAPTPWRSPRIVRCMRRLRSRGSS